MSKKIFFVTYLIILLAGLGFYLNDYFSVLEEKWLDIVYRFRGPMNLESKVILVGITDDCLKELDEWPLPRSRYANIIRTIKDLGARTIALDIIFDLKNTNEPEGDQELVKSVVESGNVVLGYSIKKSKVLNMDESPDAPRFIDSFSFLEPFGELNAAAASRGLINAEIEPLNKDGITRKMFHSFDDEGTRLLAFPFTIAEHYFSKKIEAPFYPFDVHTSFFYMNYFEHSRTETIPFKDFFNEEKVRQMRSLNYIKDKVVIIGPAFGEKDYYYTPFGRTRGMKMHADTINAICYGKYVRSVDRKTNIILTVILMIVAYFLFTQFNGGYFFTLILSTLYAASSLYLFKWFGLIIDVLPVVICILSASTLSLFINLYYRLWEANQSLKKRVIELTILYDISNKLSEMEMSDQEKRLKILIDKSTPALDADRGSVMILDPFTEELEVRAVFDKRFKQFRKGIKLKLGEGIAGRVAISGKPIKINNVKDDDRFVIFTDKDEEIRNLLTVPMITQNKTIGVLNYVNKHNKQVFSEADLKLAMTISQAAATVIENARLYREATIDGMTGLYVHRYFKRRLAEELQRARRYNKSLSLIMTDIDHFKVFNDTYGHQIGDFVLQGVAGIIHDAVRDIDVPARYGGEEFIVILPETTQDGAHILAERIRQKIETTDFKTESGVLRVTISVGVSTYPETDVEEADAFVKSADEALYEAKQTGRNRTVVYNKKD